MSAVPVDVIVRKGAATWQKEGSCGTEPRRATCSSSGSTGGRAPRGVIAMARMIASSGVPEEVKSAVVSSAQLAATVLADLPALVKPQAGLDKRATFGAVFADAPAMQAPEACRKPKAAPSHTGASTGQNLRLLQRALQPVAHGPDHLHPRE
jgi:hypothetical protein